MGSINQCHFQYHCNCHCRIPRALLICFFWGFQFLCGIHIKIVSMLKWADCLRAGRLFFCRRTKSIKTPERDGHFSERLQSHYRCLSIILNIGKHVKTSNTCEKFKTCENMCILCLFVYPPLHGALMNKISQKVK